MIETKPFFGGFLRRRSCVLPTWRGWCALLLACAVAAITAIHGAYFFLATNDPAPGGVLVAEGWGNDDFMADVMTEFQRNRLVLCAVPVLRAKGVAPAARHA